LEEKQGDMMSGQQNNLISPDGAPGPRIDVLLRMFDRIAEFEEEVRTGKRVIAEPIKTETGKTHETKNSTPRRKRSRLAK